MDFTENAQGVLYGGCSDGHLVACNNRHIDPMLKLYQVQRVMINWNKDVENYVANGARCRFEGVKLKDGVTLNDLETIWIDGYFVRSAAESQIDHIILRNAPKNKDNVRPLVRLEPRREFCKVSYPVTLYGPVTKGTPRIEHGITLEQFPINVSTATTVHKLQGRSIDNLLISSFDYTDNWIYVALSRVKTRVGLFLRKPLDGSKLRGMSQMLLAFHDQFRQEKCPIRVVEV